LTKRAKDEFLVKSKILDLKNPKLKSCKYISGLYRDFTGKISKFPIRDYQIRGILMMCMIKRMVLGDETGLGKTAQAIYTYCYLLEENPDLKLLWVGPKTTLPEKMDEFKVMTKGIKAVLYHGSLKKRKDIWRGFKSSKTNVMVTTYGTMRRDYAKIAHALGDSYMIMFDEATDFKNPGAATHKNAKFLANRAERVYGISATIIMNRLDEAYGIYSVIYPELFDSRKDFETMYHRFRYETSTTGFKRKVVTGYRNLPDFRDRIAGYFIGRRPEDVGEQLPEITPKEYTITLSRQEMSIYREKVIEAILHAREVNAPKGAVVHLSLRLALCSGIHEDYEEAWEAAGTRSAKEEAIIDLLKTEFAAEKVIIYAVSKKWINRFQKILKKEGIDSVKVTGDENQKQRQENIAEFNQQDHCKVCLITDAGNKGINLQIARIMIFAQLPWSYGNLKQILGRYRRLGTTHQALLAIFMVASKTNDRRVMAALKSKKQLFKEILKDSLETLDSDNRDLSDLYNGLEKDMGLEEDNGSD